VNKNCQILIFVILNLLNQFLTILSILTSFFHCSIFLLIFFWFFLYFLLFCAGIQKWVMTVAPLFTMLTKQRICIVSVVKINKTIFPTLIFSKLGWPETPFGNSFVSKHNIMYGWVKLRFLSPILFNQNQNSCVVRIDWDSSRQSPLTRTKILCVVRIDWDSSRQSPLTRTKILCG